MQYRITGTSHQNVPVFLGFRYQALPHAPHSVARSSYHFSTGSSIPGLKKFFAAPSVVVLAAAAAVVAVVVTVVVAAAVVVG